MSKWIEYLQSQKIIVDKEISFKCPNCEYKSKSKGNLQCHVNSNHRAVRFKCTECQYESKRKHDLQIHINSIHKGETFPCPECDYQGGSDGSVRHSAAPMLTAIMSGGVGISGRELSWSC